MNRFKVYYDTKINQLVIVTRYMNSSLYSYVTDILFILRKEPPHKYKSLVYLGLYGGDLYDQE